MARSEVCGFMKGKSDLLGLSVKALKAYLLGACWIRESKCLLKASEAPPLSNDALNREIEGSIFANCHGQAL